MANVRLDEPQLKAVREMHNGSILKGGVGSGKTRTGLHYFVTKACGGEISVNGQGDTRAPERPKDLYIITTARKRESGDWESEAADFGLSPDREISFGGIQVKVDSWNNIVNYENVKGAFFIFDEQRLVGNGAWVKAFLKLAKHNEWIILSATPGDNWMDYCPVFIANGFYKNRTEFTDEHVKWKPYSKYPQIERFINQGPLIRYRKQILVEMPVKRHTVRNVRNTIVEFDEVLFNRAYKDRWHVYEDRPIRDIAELFSVMRKIVNSDPDRVNKLLELMDKHPRLIVFYNFNYELDILRMMAEDLDITVGEWNGQKHEEVPTGDNWLYFVQYTAGAEAWNCTTTDATIFFSLNYSYKVNEQARGRIDRRDTPYTQLYYYIFRSNSYIDNQIIKSLLLKKDFNEKEAMPV